MAQEPEPEPRDRSLDRSRALLERATRVIPEATQTSTKGPKQWPRGSSPTHLERGKGCRVWDVDGNEYVDHVSSLGPIILGHDYPEVTAAAQAQIERGTMFSMPHPLQVEVAERITEMVPCAEMVRFAKNGHDVTDLATKVMRAATGRDVVATQGYHGWTDQWRNDRSLALGVPHTDFKVHRFDYNDVASLEAVFEAHEGDVAGVITTAVNRHPPEDDFLERVRELCDEHDALLAFDEILTGFRFAPGGAGEFFGVTPDLACFAKGMANGYPISALAGRREVMRIVEDDDFVFSMTYAGDAVSLAAADATLEVLRDEPVHEHIFDVGRRIRDGYAGLVDDYGLGDVTGVAGYPPQFRVTFADHAGLESRWHKSLVMQECMDRGVLFSGNHLPSYSVTDEDVEETLRVYEAALAELADALANDAVADRLRGEPVGATIRERTGDDG